MPDYALYGLVVRSDQPLAGLVPAIGASRIDVHIALSGGAPAARAWADVPVHYRGPDAPNGEPSVDVRLDPHRGFWFRYPDGTEFTLDREGTEITAWWAHESSLEDTATYLLGPVLGFALRLRGVLALHASAVIVDGRALALVGPSGAGKSTAAAAFAAAGFPVLADDVLAVRASGEEVVAYPSYRLLRLWGESERMLFGTTGELPRLTPTWDKRALPLGGAYPFHETPAPLGDVFLLAPRAEDGRAPFVEPVGAGEALVSLVLNTYANYLLDDRMRGDELRALEGLMRGRRVRTLIPHANPDRLGALVDLVCAAARGR